jgi:hypothetical protein
MKSERIEESALRTYQGDDNSAGTLWDIHQRPGSFPSLIAFPQELLTVSPYLDFRVWFRFHS